jgi:signal transduction histidine kinase
MGHSTVAAVGKGPTNMQVPRRMTRGCAHEGRRRLADVVASRARLVAAFDAARRQVERDLHDGAQQGLVSLALRLRLLSAGPVADPDALRRELSALAEEVDRLTAELRDLAHGIHPAALSRRGLGPVLQSLARRAPLPVDVTVRVPVRPASTVEAGIYFVVAEALANVVKHAEASRAAVAVEHRHGRVTVEITDDGVGGADPRAGSGLVGMRDRVEALGGTLAVRSPHGEGTCIVASLPARCADERDGRCA